MSNNLNRIASDLADISLETYWPGFKKVAYALYDKSFVHLFNHPKFESGDGKVYQTFKWDEQFTGDTLILYSEYPTAIVNLELHNDYESLFSILVHELFHGYQYLREEKRFPNEMLGFMYPLSKENIEIRSQERASLFNALMAKNAEEEQLYISTFVALREKRASLMIDYLEFENLIETVEGPAWYVELNAFSHKSDQTYEMVLQKYGQNLIDKVESSLNIRRSCYSSGLFMCLLLDTLSSQWQEAFFRYNNSLFEFFKEQYNSLSRTAIDRVQVSDETEEIVNIIKRSKECEFDNFIKQEGIHFFVEGNIKTISIDPMNIIALENKLLHKNFIKVMINNAEYLIQQPVIAYIKGSFKETTKLHFVLNKTPIENNDSVIIDGVGELKGNYDTEKRILFLNTKQ
jgi:hypothetical protein